MTEPTAEPDKTIEPAAEPAEEAKKSSGLFKGCILPLLVIVVSVVVMLQTCSGGGNRETSADDARIHGRDICRDAVKNGLKAPSTAKFSSEDVSVNDQGTMFHVKVSGIVEAENSFGGMVGYDFTCSANVPKKDGEVTGKVTSMTER